MVGGVASLADSLAWYERLPLFGLRIGITRTSRPASTLAAREAGLEIVPELSANSSRGLANAIVRWSAARQRG